MRISLKSLAYLWVGLLIIIGGLLYNAYSKFKADTFIAALSEQVQKNFPGAELNVGNVAYRFSLDFNLRLQNIHLRRSDKLLGSIKEIELKVPWWLLVINKGNARISLSDLDIFIDQTEEPIEIDTDVAVAKANETISLTVPSYFAETRFTLKAKNISIREINSGRRYFMISKLLVREFQYGKNSAFELNIPIEINLNNSQYHSDLWLFGDVTPEVHEWNLNYRGEFRTREIIENSNLDDLVIKGNTKFLTTALSLNSSVSFFHDKKLVGEGSVFANQDSLLLKANLSNLPLVYLSFFYKELNSPYFPKSESFAEGSISYTKKFETNQATIEGRFESSGEIKINDFSSPGRWQVGLLNNKWDLSFVSPKGDVSYFRRAIIDFDSKDSRLFNDELSLVGMQIDQLSSLIPSFEWLITTDNKKFFSTSVALKDCLLEDKLINGSLSVGRNISQAFYKIDFTGADSSFKMNFLEDHNKSHSLDLLASNFTLVPSFKLLSPVLNITSPLALEGKVEGRWSENWTGGEWLIKVKASNLFEQQGLFPEFLSKSIGFFDLKSQDNKSESVEISVRKHSIWIDSLNFEGTESYKLSGRLSAKEKSTLTLSFPKNKKKKAVHKDVIEAYWMNKEVR